jgi:hypothetical protein
MRDAKPLTRNRLKWLLRQDAFVAWFWLRVNDWRVPRDPDRLFLLSGVLYKIEREFFSVLEDEPRSYLETDVGVFRTLGKQRRYACHIFLLSQFPQVT